MNYRTFGRLGWKVSEVGYGMWGIAGGVIAYLHKGGRLN